MQDLIIADGMLSYWEWNALDARNKIIWLATLTNIEARAQASVVAIEKQQSVHLVLFAWLTERLISQERASAISQAKVQHG